MTTESRTAYRRVVAEWLVRLRIPDPCLHLHILLEPPFRAAQIRRPGLESKKQCQPEMLVVTTGHD